MTWVLHALVLDGLETNRKVGLPKPVYLILNHAEQLVPETLKNAMLEKIKSEGLVGIAVKVVRSKTLPHSEKTSMEQSIATALGNKVIIAATSQFVQMILRIYK